MVDDNFLQKFLYFKQQLADVFVVPYRGGAKNSCLTGLCDEFCSMVLRKSEFEDGGKVLQVLDAKLDVEDFCGYSASNDEFTYWGMIDTFYISDGWVFYQLTKNVDYTMCVSLKIKLEDFNNFLTWLFTYIDNDCFNKFNNLEGAMK